MKSFKKYIAILLVLFLVFGSMPMNSLPCSKGIFDILANAYSEENGYEYYLLANNTARISSLTQYFSGTVNIPATLGGYTVTEIGQSVFENEKDVTGVTIPAGVKLIDDNAFRGCDGLLSVSLPAGLTTIGDNVFMDCIHMITVSVPNSVINFGSSVFFNCAGLQNADIGTGVTTLPSLTFGQCTSLVGVSLPATLQIIGYGAFMESTALINIVIPSSVTEIGQYAFRECSKLSGVSFTLPANLLTLGNGAFYGCTSLVNISIPGTCTTFNDYAFYGCSALTVISIPYGTAVIPESMFEQCTMLTNVTLPNTVTTISKNAFARCISLAFLVFPANLTVIGDWAFYYCGLKKPDLPAGLSTIGASAFKQCYNLAIVSIPSAVTFLSANLFSDCSSLVSVTVPNSVNNFGAGVFTNCSNLILYGNNGSVIQQYANANSIPFTQIVSVSLTFNANGGTPSMNFTQNCGTALTAPEVTRTGYTFAGWSPAVPAVMPAVNTTYTAQWTVNKYKVEYRYGGTVTAYMLNYGSDMIPPLIYFQPDDLTVFTGWVPEIPASVPAQDMIYTAQYTQVYTYTVSDNKATITAVSTLISGLVNIPAALGGYPVISIGYHAFQNCVDITGISIPPSVTFIDARAFMGCTGLTAAAIPTGVTSIGNQAFQDCTALASITVPDSVTSIGGGAFLNTAWFNAKPDGPVYAGKVFYRYKGTMPAGTNIDVASGTLGIAGSAFSGCTGLNHIVLPESLTVIGAYAFSGCSGIAEIIIPESVAGIGTGAFQNCTILTLGCYGASYAHSYANTNDIPHAIVVKITFDANGGTGGTSTAMYIGAALTAPAVTFPSFVFNGWSPALPATVPEVNTTYTAQWVTLLSYTIANETVTITGLNASLNGMLTIPDMIEGFPVKYIAAAALKNMTGLTGVDFPAGLLTIGEQAFRGCTGLTNITLPSTLTTIEGAAFNGCTNLTSIIIPASVRTIGTDVFTGCPGLTLYVYPRSRAMLYAENNHLNYRVFVTVSFSLNGGTGTVPAPQSGLDGDEVIIPAQGDIARTGYHYLGWSTSPTATEAFANFTMAPDNITLYAVWSRIPSIAAFSGATTVINEENGFIYGLSPGITQAKFESVYITLAGNGRLEYTMPSGGFGTGTQVKLIDNVTGLVLKTYTIVIFGDVNGDGNITGIDAGIMVNVENYMVTWDPVTDAALIKAGNINGDSNVNGLDAGIAVNVENYLTEINQVTGLA